MLLKEEAWGAGRVRLGGQHHPARPPACTYAVRLPEALLPPPPLVLPDEPGGGALLGGAAQPGVAGVGRGQGHKGQRRRGQRRRGCREVPTPGLPPRASVRGGAGGGREAGGVCQNLSSQLHTSRSARVRHANPTPTGNMRHNPTPGEPPRPPQWHTLVRAPSAHGHACVPPHTCTQHAHIPVKHPRVCVVHMTHTHVHTHAYLHTHPQPSHCVPTQPQHSCTHTCPYTWPHTPARTHTHQNTEHTSHMPAHTCPHACTRAHARAPARVVVLIGVDEAAGLELTAQQGGGAVGGQAQVPAPAPPRVPVGPGGCGDRRAR